MDFLIKLYTWGIVAELLFHLYSLIMYSFGFRERKTYQANLNKVGLSWDPLYLKVYPLSDFKHTTLRFWTITFLDLLGCLLSWYQVLYRIHKIMKVREIDSMLTPEQKQAAFGLRKDPGLSTEEATEKLKILEPALTVREPGSILISKEVDSKEFSRQFAKTLLDEKGRNVLVPLLQASGMNVTSREIAIMKYIVGEADRDFVLHVLEERRKNEADYQEAEIQNRQIEALKSILGAEAANA
jgi:hypothetical protein